MKVTAYEIRTGVQIVLTRPECEKMLQMMVLILGMRQTHPDVINRDDADYAQAFITLLSSFDWEGVR